MLIDITQELFSCRVYPGDPKPEKVWISSMENGDEYDLTGLSMCAHNGTHVDAPSHFIEGGRTIDQLGLEPFVGECYVARMYGDVRAEDAANILKAAEKAGAKQRILIAGNVTVTEEAAEVFAKAELLLLGNESQTVGPEDAPMRIHQILLGSGCVLLEGIVLDGVEEGRYFLSAAPLKLGGCEGAPCRAYLMTESY
jgi:arylformamidase